MYGGKGILPNLLIIFLNLSNLQLNLIRKESVLLFCKISIILAFRSKGKKLLHLSMVFYSILKRRSKLFFFYQLVCLSLY